MLSFVTERVLEREAQHDGNENKGQHGPQVAAQEEDCSVVVLPSRIGMHQITPPPNNLPLPLVWHQDGLAKTANTQLIADHLRKTDGRQTTKHRTPSPQAGLLAANPIEEDRIKCTRRHRRQPRCICLMNESIWTICCLAKKTTHAAISFSLSLVCNPTRIHRRNPPGSSHESGGDKLHDLHIC